MRRRSEPIVVVIADEDMRDVGVVDALHRLLDELTIVRLLFDMRIAGVPLLAEGTDPRGIPAPRALPPRVPRRLPPWVTPRPLKLVTRRHPRTNPTPGRERVWDPMKARRRANGLPV